MCQETDGVNQEEGKRLFPFLSATSKTKQRSRTLVLKENAIFEAKVYFILTLWVPEII